MPILDLNNMKVESKWHAFTSKAREKAADIYWWVKNNPETAGVLATVGTAVIGGAVKVGKSLVRTYNLRQEKYNKDRYIYDRSLGMYLHTRRPLRNQDFVIINSRRKNGERLADILTSMRILD